MISALMWLVRGNSNGGPIILFQPENEYTLHTPNITDFPDHAYFGAVSRMWRDQGIVVPFVSNDQYAAGLFAPTRSSGSAPGKDSEDVVDIYGYDSYPLGFDCSNPRAWPDGNLPTDFLKNHTEQNPYSPHTIGEFQGGAFDPWGGVGFEKCEELVNEEFERVFFKNNFAAGVTVFNVYMGYGGCVCHTSFKSFLFHRQLPLPFPLPGRALPHGKIADSKFQTERTGATSATPAATPATTTAPPSPKTAPSRAPSTAKSSCRPTSSRSRPHT